ncbi:MAG: hypothetical protein H3C41_11800, partial [Bacteroidales bacterium]|nr:hypothetical protein [Bacteroidales bacterium]
GSRRADAAKGAKRISQHLVAKRTPIAYIFTLAEASPVAKALVFSLVVKFIQCSWFMV